jgi:hypothetical protein
MSHSEFAPRGEHRAETGVKAARTRKRAFLALEAQREELSARLARRTRHAKRYRDLIVAIAVVSLQRKQLVEPTTPRWPEADSPEPQVGHAMDEAEVLADWARPWGGACLLGLQADFESYRRDRDRVERWLTTETKKRAKAEAAARLRAIRREVAEAVREPVQAASTNALAPEPRYTRDAHPLAGRTERRRGSVS